VDHGMGPMALQLNPEHSQQQPLHAQHSSVGVAPVAPISEGYGDSFGGDASHAGYRNGGRNGSTHGNAAQIVLPGIDGMLKLKYD